MWVFLPAVWPRSHRTWVRRERDRVVTTYEMDIDGNVISKRVTSWTDEDYAVEEEDSNVALADAGLPARPPDRTWYLRSPSGVEQLDDVLRRLIDDADANSIEPWCNSEFVAFVSRRLRETYPW
ncbi:DUF5956 family protein [Phytoactinopolyspora halotolerans]